VCASRNRTMEGCSVDDGVDWGSDMATA